MKEEIKVVEINVENNKLDVEINEKFTTIHTKQYTFYISKNKNKDFYFFKLDVDRKNKKSYTNKLFLFNSKECCTCEINLNDDCDNKYYFLCDTLENNYLEYVDEKTNDELVDKYSHKLDEAYDFLTRNYEEIIKKCLNIINKELSLN